MRIGYLTVLLPTIACAQPISESDLEIGATLCEQHQLHMIRQGVAKLGYEQGFEACEHIIEQWKPIKEKQDSDELARKRKAAQDVINGLKK